ncbi:MAG: potassium transporter KtrB [Ruminococcaceae bacterium]|nr:potassium transporter KtrB [Oscillospiraceae bacterium]
MKKIKLSSTHIILVVFLLTILLGSLLLYLPISSANGKSVAYIDALFTSTTATCVTGLVTVTTASAWSPFGQAVILLLIQIGGLGVITVMSAFMMIIGKRISLDGRLLIMDSFNLNSLSGIIQFIKKVILGTLIIEAVGALLYMTVFVPEFGAKGIWYSIFNSVSAFCNAGLDIISDTSMCNYATNPLINSVTSALIIVGGLGFIVWWDIVRVFKNRHTRHFKYLSLHSKLVLSSTLILIVSGAVLFFIFEYNNPETFGNMNLFGKIQASLFQSITTRTAGFASVPQEALTNPSSIVTLILMFIGGSPVSTAGGIKTVTVAVLILTAYSVICGKKQVSAFGRNINEQSIRRAVTVFISSFAIFTISALCLSCTSDAPLIDILFETVSATATVGLSRNFTTTLSLIGKIIIIINMYFGRVGPITLAFAFKTGKNDKNTISEPSEDISIG